MAYGKQEIFDSMTFVESHYRTIAKTITVRVCFTLSHIVNGWIVTGSWMTGVTIASFAVVINMLLFWGHERTWNRAQWNRKPKDDMFFVDGHPRTISKSVTWRILITMNNFLIPFLTTGSWTAALAFLTIATILNVGVYYTHERVWNRIRWGKLSPLIITVP
jgi:uncharacterized membrane protein